MLNTAWTAIFTLVFSTVVSVHSHSSAPEGITLGPATNTPISATSSVASSQAPEQLAKCLSTKGAQMYGAFWCPHCADQKKNFGASFQYIKYTECDPKGPNPDPKACKAAGVQGYPTWTIPGGEKLTGTQSLDALAVWSKCPLSK